MLASDCGHNTTNSRALLYVSVLQLGHDPASAEEHSDRLSVPGAHAVVDEDVEGGVDVGGDLQVPQRREDRILVATSCIQLRHEKLNKPSRKKA